MSEGTVVWLTGLPGAGKTTIAEMLCEVLERRGSQVCVLDGDELRAGLCSDLGFAAADRLENIRRVTEVARLLIARRMVVIVALVSPYRAHRAFARLRFPPGRFIEAFVDCPVEVCRARDPKGLYRRADRGEVPGLTGVSAPYEAPEAVEAHLQTDGMTVDRCVGELLALIEAAR